MKPIERLLGDQATLSERDPRRSRGFGEDRPQTEEARLWKDLRELSVRLVKVIQEASPSSPILITGDWGSGKSSLLEVTRKKLMAEDYLTVWFGAWNYEGEGPLLPLLLRALWQHAPRDLIGSREAKRRWQRLSRLAQKVAKKTPEVALLAGAVGLNMHLLHLAVPFVERRDDKDGEVDAIATVHREFGWLVELLAAERSDHPVVFFIDDLDRCNPLAALSLIESLRLLIGGNEAASEQAPNARYVVALDHAALVRAVCQKFGGMSTHDGNRYLEKIFPISFHLPQPAGADIHQFVQAFLDPAGDGTPPLISDDDKDVLGLAMADPIFANPRLMKRCIERFRMVLEFENKARPDDYEQLFLAKWIAAGERWPSLRRLFARHGDDYWREIGTYLSGAEADGLDEERRELLGEQDIRAWLRRELFGAKGTRLEAYRRADLRLRQFGL